MPQRPKPARPKAKDPSSGLDAALYRGRGQTFAKHVLLKQYLQELAFKVLQSPQRLSEFVYLDGFSGPWQSQGEAFEDTSFCIALTVLTNVRETLASKGQYPDIRAIFVEESAEAFARLKEALTRFPRITVQPLAGKLENKVPEIRASLRPDSFLFAFLDPFGWKDIALRHIEPLLTHRPGEVLVNVMMDSLRRHVMYEGVATSAAGFFGGGEWRAELEEAIVRLGDREAAILEVYLRRLRATGGFNYVSSTRVRDPDKARTYFHLAYGTRHPAGMEVFRRSEQRCIKVQERVVVEAYHERRELKAGIEDLFRQTEDQDFDAFEKWRDEAHAKAKAEFADWLKAGAADRASHRRAVLMQHPHVTAKLVSDWVRDAKRAGVLRQQGEGSNELWVPIVAKDAAKQV